MLSFKNMILAAAGTGALALSLAIPTLSHPTAADAQMRGEVGSARNLLYVRRRVEAMIDQLQHDQHDYGGYRVKAIADLQQARADIAAGIAYDSTHGH